MTRFFDSLPPNMLYGVVAIAVASLFLFSCGSKKEEKESDKVESLPRLTSLSHPEWSKNAVIYEVNIRQFSQEGSFDAVTKDLPRLKELGIDVLWLMPIFPIGEKNKKGTLGSYYSVRDYEDISPEFGTKEDFANFVQAAHNLNMKVVLDWVANHTSWDNKWIYDHPEWYTVDDSGEMVSPFDWSDVADLNYDNMDMQQAMINALKYWVKNFDVDGFRCDVAGMVPVEFWNRARKELDAIKPVFMLAEAEDAPLIVDAFDMEYGWEFHNVMNHVAKGDMDCDSIEAYFVRQLERNPQNAYKMNFTSNHDENSWNGTVWERLGDGAYTYAVLAATVPGMPLVYTGQEAGLDKRLEFFEKDPVDWKDHEFFGLYKKLFQLKHENPALWNGAFGGTFDRVETSNNEEIYAFMRVKDDHSVIVVLNLSDKAQNITIANEAWAGTYKNLFDDKQMNIPFVWKLDLNPWEYRVYYQ